MSVPSKHEDIFEGDSTKSVLNLGRTGVYLSSLEGDVRLLMRTFQRLQAYDFASFCEVWKALDFSLIHFVATEKNSRQNFMRTAYRLLLGHFQPSAILEIRIGVVYALYLMYFTQPVNFPNINIRVTMELWVLMTQLYEYCKEADIRDVMYVFDRLVSEGAFEQVAWTDDNEGVLRLEIDEDGVSGRVASKLADIEHEVMGSGQGGLGDLAASKRQIILSDAYRNNKRRLINTQLIEEATREFYTKEFGTTGEPKWGLPSAVPLDISEQDTSWSSSIFSRVREYQRLRAERVGTITEDDGSLLLTTDYAEAKRGILPLSSAQIGHQTSRMDTSLVDYSLRNTDNMSTPIRVIQRAHDMERLRSHLGEQR
ncbi:hypothetical protein LPJ59_000279 [Coemansia sp. RSA 2399]|nr:hypothetical protein LPJ59_000279 [Coemansia sp. RSA 2399]KAJ1907612.1 hypothetical protein LPJ81_000631 [Coemansia sp. IMI 209127]